VPLNNHPLTQGEKLKERSCLMNLMDYMGWVFAADLTIVSVLLIFALIFVFIHEARKLLRKRK
jgi:hypothetical protein